MDRSADRRIELAGMTMESPREIVWTDELLARFWSYYARFPEAYFSHQCGAAVVTALRGEIAANASVLDYGCGPGFLLGSLLDAGYRVTGADLSIDTMGRARESFAGRPGLEGLHTIDELLASRRVYDAVFLLEVVEHLDDQRIEQTLDDIRRLLKPGGKLIVTTPNNECLDDNMVFCPISNVVFHRWQHVRSWSRETLSECLARRGFEKVVVTARTFPSRADQAQGFVGRMVRRVMSRVRKPRTLFAIASR